MVKKTEVNDKREMEPRKSKRRITKCKPTSDKDNEDDKDDEDHPSVAQVSHPWRKTKANPQRKTRANPHTPEEDQADADDEDKADDVVAEDDSRG